MLRFGVPLAWIASSVVLRGPATGQPAPRPLDGETAVAVASVPRGPRRLEDLPGYASAREVDAARGQLAVGGLVEDVTWLPDGSGVEFTRGEERLRFTFATGQVAPPPAAADGDAAEAQDAGDRRPRRERGPRPARGRQAARVPSPDGQWTAVCVDHNVVLEREGTPVPSVVTTDGVRKLGYGRASWVYGEELDQDSAMWWSPDSTMLAFYRFDDREVPDFQLPVDWTELRPRIELESYPKPGDPNPVAGILVHHLGSGQTVTVDVGANPDQYVYAVQWTPDGRELLFLRTNRRQDVLELVAADPRTGTSRVVLIERQETFQNNRPVLRFLEDGQRFIWETERTGWAQYELRHIDGRLLATLTQGERPVLGIESLDEEAGWLYYRAASPDVGIATQLERVRLDGTDQVRITTEELHHGRFEIAPDHRHLVCSAESIATPPRTLLYDMQGRLLSTLAEPDTSRMRELGLPMPERIEFLAADGVTRLWGELYRPRHADAAGPLPLVIDVYGGPGVRGLQDRWEGARSECEYGFALAKLENRGTLERGKAFEAATYLKLGQADIDDQAAGVRALSQRPDIDGSRVGIFGASYGGTMSALALLRHPELFDAAVATSGVTDWRNYDTIYTERYMRTPAENPEGYDAGSCVKLAEALEGPQPWRLLILHGMVDDNVHPTNAWQLVDVLQRRNVPFEMLLFPRADHSVGGPAARGARWGFLVDALGATPIEHPAQEAGETDAGTGPAAGAEG